MRISNHRLMNSPLHAAAGISPVYSTSIKTIKSSVWAVNKYTLFNFAPRAYREMLGPTALLSSVRSLICQLIGCRRRSVCMMSTASKVDKPVFCHRFASVRSATIYVHAFSGFTAARQIRRLQRNLSASVA